ncbi:MAG TPA: cyclic nucleotide-binding domain-containing protein [Anaerolineae bacterium]|nr:cyclic nucleotide-binding domain-containing protein [Anaerolineae bacterium]
MEERVALLRNTFLFGDLSEGDLSLVAGLLKRRSERPRSTVYRQGDPDTNFYIVASGRVKVWSRDERGRQRLLNHLQTTDSFGAHSLLTGARRDVTVDVEEPTVLLYLEKHDFDTLLEDHPHLREELSLNILERLREVPLFSRLSLEELHHMSDAMGRTSYRQGSTIYRQGELSTTFYIIESGRVALLAKEAAGELQVFTHLRDGDIFGERSLLTGQPRDTSIVAVEDTSLLYLNKRDFDALLADVPSVRRALTLEANARELMLSERFPWQREGEVLVALARKHPYALIRSLWVLFFPLICLAAIVALSFAFDWPGPWLYAACALTLSCAVGLVVWQWADWRNDYYVVTSKRVIHQEKTILLRESRDEAPLENIQDISIVMPSIVGRVLGFNDMSIQTAGAKGRVVFGTVGHAPWIRDKLFQQMELLKVEDHTEQRDTIRRRLQVEMGQTEEQALPTVEPERAAATAAPGTPQVTSDEVSLPRDLLSRIRSYFVPRMRIEENGVVTWRKHWFRLIDRTAGPIILLFVLIQLGIAVQGGLIAPPPRFVSLLWGDLVLGGTLGLFLIWFRYEDWRNDIYQLTDDRIIDVERLPLGLREERREANLSMIQDIGYEIPGPVANLLDYGNVVIETAGRDASFTFSWVHHPRQVQEEVFARMDAYRERDRQRQRERRAEELLDWFGTYADLSGQQNGTVDERGE